MSALSWAWVAGLTMGFFGGVQAGRWSVFALLRNPLGQLARAYRKLLADIDQLILTGRWT